MNIKIERPKTEKSNSVSVTFTIEFDSDPENVGLAFDKILKFMRDNMPREDFEDIARELWAKLEECKRASVAQ